MNKHINMVESEVEPMNKEINRENVVNEIRRLELMSFFRNMEDEKKIEWIVSRASYDLIDWHYETIEVCRKISFAKWKQMALEAFGSRTLSLAKLYRMKQDKEESIKQYIENVKSSARIFKLKEEEVIEIITGGIRDEFVRVKNFLEISGSLDEKIIEKLVIIEEECAEEIKKKQEMQDLLKKLEILKIETSKQIIKCYNCQKLGHIARNCHMGSNYNQQGSKKKVNEVSTELSDIIKNKENSVYFYGQEVPVVFDTGSTYNFISNAIAIKFNLPFQWNSKEMVFKTCLEEPFIVNKHTFIEVTYKDQVYRLKFFILPKVRIEKVLIGKNGMREMMEAEDEGYVCEIKTEPGKKVVEPVYTLSKNMEEGVEIAIQKLLSKGYIQESKSTWLNNLRPVIKPDGSIRVTTNLVALNKLVDLDRYSLPRIDEILCNLRGMKFFSKLDLEDSFLKTKLKRAIEIYNNTFHTGILMTPQEATMANVQDKLRQIQIENIIKYNKKHGQDEREHFFRPGEVVLIRQEGNGGKGSPKFKVRGCIFKALKNNAYIIKIGKKKIKRHASQLKLLVDEPIL